jgi:hypothetical protein
VVSSIGAAEAEAAAVAGVDLTDISRWGDSVAGEKARLKYPCTFCWARLPSAVVRAVAARSFREGRGRKKGDGGDDDDDEDEDREVTFAKTVLSEAFDRHGLHEVSALTKDMAPKDTAPEMGAGAGAKEAEGKGPKDHQQQQQQQRQRQHYHDGRKRIGVLLVADGASHCIRMLIPPSAETVARTLAYHTHQVEDNTQHEEEQDAEEHEKQAYTGNNAKATGENNGRATGSAWPPAAPASLPPSWLPVPMYVRPPDLRRHRGATGEPEGRLMEWMVCTLGEWIVCTVYTV